MERNAQNVARALHDGLAQDLVALAYRIELLADSDDVTPPLARELRAISLHTNLLTRALRDQIYLLRDSKFSLTDALTSLIKEVSTPLHIECADIQHLLSIQEQQLVFQVAQELVRNSARHAGATHIELTIAADGESVTLAVRDDGVGGASIRSKHFGLQGLYEIAELLGGEITIESGIGTWASLTFPIVEQ